MYTAYKKVLLLMDFVWMVDHVCCYPTEIVSYRGKYILHKLDLDIALLESEIGQFILVSEPDFYMFSASLF